MTSYAKEPGSIVLADGSSLPMTSKTINLIASVSDTSFNLTLLKPFFEKFKNKGHFTNEELRFANTLTCTFAARYRGLFGKAKKAGDVNLLRTVKDRSQIMVTYILSIPITVKKRKLINLPRKCEKELLFANVANNKSQQTIANTGSDDLRMIIKEQREQIEYLKKRLQDCESGK